VITRDRSRGSSGRWPFICPVIAQMSHDRPVRRRSMCAVDSRATRRSTDPVVPSIDASIATCRPTRGGAWRRLILAAAAVTCCRSNLIRALGRQLALRSRSERGISSGCRSRHEAASSPTARASRSTRRR
jgi:hypothetical protein